MKENTKKQLEEAMNREFNESFDDYGIPAEVIALGREICEKTEKIIDIMSGMNLAEEVKRENIDSYQSIKFVMMNKELMDCARTVRSLRDVLNMTREDLDEVCKDKGVSIKELEKLVLINYAMKMIKD